MTDLKHLHRKIEAQVPRKTVRDLLNRLRFGPNAPKSDETIWIRPKDVTHAFRRSKHYGFKRRNSGTVVAGDWDLQRRPLEEMVKFAACQRHFVEGIPWEETGIYDEMMRRIAIAKVVDGCTDLDSVRARYAGIDRLYEAIKAAGRIEVMTTQPDYLRREHGGIFVHIDRDGLPMLAGNGNHRMAMARILDLPVIPAHLGVIHAQALAAGHLDRLRDPDWVNAD